MLEVLNHKYTDISETNFGAAILNDSKYGISVDGTAAALTLLKGGLHPDTRGDEGVYAFTYSLLPHGAFSAQSVTRPAYELNRRQRPRDRSPSGGGFRPQRHHRNGEACLRRDRRHPPAV